LTENDENPPSDPPPLTPADPDHHLDRLSEKKRPVARLVFLITALACLLVLALAAWFIAAARHAQLREAEVANTNVARMIAVQVESTLKTADVALVNVVERVEHDGIEGAALDRLQAHLGEVSRTSPELHGLFVYGADGTWLATSLGRPAVGSNSDRAYFQYHRAHPGRGLHVGPPIRSRSTGVWVIPVSRRIEARDGGFAGVALVTLKVDFFERIYDELDIGKTGTVLLALSDGTVVYRRPLDDKLIGTNISQGPVLQEVSRRGSGSSILVSGIDRIERLYSFRRVSGVPFIVAVGRTKNELLSDWERASILIGAAALLVCAMAALLANRLFRQIVIRDQLDQQLRARSDDLEQHNVGLQVLAHTDKLTGIANRLMFDTVLERELKRAQRGDACLSLILLDVDYFKKFNDRYGHPAGDSCLHGVGRVLAEQVIRAGDLAARYGGEEFAVILPNTDRSGAIAVAERIRMEILALAIAHGDAPAGTVSASLGVATVAAGQETQLRPADLVARADARLYEAKRGGRNTVRA
jgi:diguanylate cyclase (GGDEF)-like protein